MFNLTRLVINITLALQHYDYEYGLGTGLPLYGSNTPCGTCQVGLPKLLKPMFRIFQC